MVLAIVLKIRPDRSVRPVQLGTGLQSGQVMSKNRKLLKNWKKLKTGQFNRKTRNQHDQTG